MNAVVRVGIIGYGVMGKAHSYGYRVAPMLRRLPVVLGRFLVMLRGLVMRLGRILRS